MVDAIPEHNRINEQCPVADFKAVKNEGELRGMRAAHVRDGAAVAPGLFAARKTGRER